MSKAVRIRLEVPEKVSEEHKAAAERKSLEAAVLTLWQAGEISTRDAA